MPRSRYSVVGKLRGIGRAELSICLPRGAHVVDDVVMVKTFAAGTLARSEGDMPDEIELSSRLHHDNIVRTLGCGSDGGKDFVVTEYLEGVTLRRLLDWLQGRDERLPDAAVARVLLGVFAAVEHAGRCAVTPAARILVQEVVVVDDVFITCKGEVKLLGFKPMSRFVGEPAQAAVDAILSTQRSAELCSVLARVGARLSPTSVLGLWQIARALETWQDESLGSDGRAELTAVMGKLLPEGRATRRAQLEAACERVRQLRLAQDEQATAGSEAALSVEASAEAADDAPPVSGYRPAQARIEIVPRTDGEGEVLMFSPAPPAAAYAERMSSPPLRLGASLPVLFETTRRQSASHRPIEMDIPANDGSTLRWPWLALAIAAGAAAAFGVHQMRRAPIAHEVSAAAAPEPASEPSAPLEQPARSTLGTAPALLASERAGTSEGSAAQPVAPAQPAVPQSVAGAQPAASQPIAAQVGPANVGEPGAPALAAPSVTAAPGAAESAPAEVAGGAPVAMPINAPAGLRSTAGRWKLPAADRPSGEAASNERAEPGAAVMARGYITLDTTPWSMVSLAGVALGQTPLVKVELPAGQHVLQLSNPELGIASSVVVDVVPGVTMVRRIGLERPDQPPH